MAGFRGQLSRGPAGSYILNPSARFYRAHGLDPQKDFENVSRLFQTDWDYPGLASTFGFVPCNQCNATDGTIDCEHQTATAMITAAGEFLDELADSGRWLSLGEYFDNI